MKIKSGFISRNVAGNNVVVAVGEQSRNFNGIIKLNESGMFLWEKLYGGIERNELIDAFLEEYDVDRATAENDIDAFIEVLKNAGAIEA